MNIELRIKDLPEGTEQIQLGLRVCLDSETEDGAQLKLLESFLESIRMSVTMLLAGTFPREGNTKEEG